jgi:uncharacterized protein YukE
MSAPGGFQVEADGLVEIAGTAHEQAERVRGYVRRMRGLRCPSADLLGEYGGVDAAYGSFLNSWAEEFELTAAALDESGVKLEESAAAYTRTDRAHADDFDRGTRPR